MTDQCIQYNEEMVGAGHPTKSDTLNRLALVEHNADGTHKYKPTGLKIGLVCNYKDGDELKISGGVIDIDGLLCVLTSTIDKAFSGLPTSGSVFVYASQPTSGNTLTAGDFSFSTTAPTRNHAKGGAWYNGTARCIFMTTTTSGGNFREFYCDGHYVDYFYNVADAVDLTPSTTPTDVTLSVPAGIDDLIASVRCRGVYVNANTYGNIRKNGSSAQAPWSFDYLLSGATYQAVILLIAVDVLAKIEVWFAHATTNRYSVHTRGFFLPEGI